jgi:hypothetical protein
MEKNVELTESMDREDEEEDTTREEPGSAMQYSTEEERNIRYSKSVVKVTKKLLARYFIMNRCLCLFMVWIHLSMALISVMVSYNTSEIKSESNICKYIFNMSHFFYGVINLLLVLIYVYLMVNFSIKTYETLRNPDWIIIIYLLLFFYVFLLKILGDMNCVFWGISFGQMLMQGMQFIAEGVLLRTFYTWLYGKTSMLKETLDDNVGIVYGAEIN